MSNDAFQYRFQFVLDYLSDRKLEALKECREWEERVNLAQLELVRAEKNLCILNAGLEKCRQARKDYSRRLLEVDGGGMLSGRNVQQKLVLLQAIEFDVAIAEEKCEAQLIAIRSKQEAVGKAENELAKARERLHEQFRTEEMFNKHREKAQGTFLRALEHKESLAQDEIGAILYQLKNT